LSTLSTSGAATLNSLGVTGAATVGTTLGVTGLTSLSTLSTSGAATLNSLGVTGAATVGTTLGVTGLTSLSTLSTSGLATLDSATITNNLTVSGTLLAGNGANIAYSGVSADWSGSAPTNVKDALDRIAARMTLAGLNP